MQTASRRFLSLQSYPISAIPRPSLFDPIPSNWSWLERHFLCPARMALATITARTLINSRFDNHYLKDHFMPGALHAIPVFFNTINEWSGENNDTVNKILHPLLLKEFQQHHKAFTMHNRVLQVN